MTNQMNITDLGLLNINRKIIDSRKYKDNLISTVGVASIIDGNASGFDKDSYLYKDNLSFKGSSVLTVEFRGTFLPTEEPQTAWKLQGTESSLLLQLTDSAIKVILNNSTILSVPIAKITDTTNIRVATNIGAGKCEVIAFLNDRVYQKNILGTTINTQDFKRIVIGNDPANTGTFWRGSFTIQNFSITENGSLIYTPSTGYPITFTKILVSDGEFPLTNTTPAITDHIYEYQINEITRSGNTVLLTSQIGEDANIIIKEVGLYAETDEGEILFSNLSGLNISTGGEVPYDLVLTVNTTLSFVNVVGFPDVGSIIVKDPEYCTFKDFKTVKDLTLYILTNLERLIILNATNIGYRKAQVFYRLQREIEQQEDCFASVQTFSKLMKKIHREIKLIFDPDAIEVVGKENFDDPGNPIITSDGEASGFETNKYVKSYIPFSSDEAWEVDSAFSVDRNGDGTILTLSNDSSIQPLVESVASLSTWITQQVGTYWGFGITYGNGKFVAVENGGYIATLEDGSTTWTTQQVVGASIWYGITYGNGKFIAVGRDGYTATLEDGSSTWTTQQVGTRPWLGITYGDGKFIAVGGDCFIATLEEGSSAWNIQQVGTSYWCGITYGNGKFIAVGESGYIATLEEGSSAWNIQRVGTNIWRGVTYENGKFVAVGDNGYMATLEDGDNTWETQQVGTSAWRGITYGNSKLIAVGSSGYIATLEDNSDTWDIQQVGTSAWLGITYGNGKFIAIGDNGYIATLSTTFNLKIGKENNITATILSEDIEYTQDDSMEVYRKFYSNYYNVNITENHVANNFNGKELSVNIESQNIESSYEEIISFTTPSQLNEYWKYTIQNPIDSGFKVSLKYDETTNGNIGMEISGKNIEDNSAWAAQRVGTNNWFGIAYGNGKFIAVGGNYDGYAATLEDSSDTWNIQQIGNDNSYSWNGITYGNDKFVAVGSSVGNSYIATLEDGSDTWTTQQVGGGPNLYSWNGIAYGNGKFIAVGSGGYIATLEDDGSIKGIQRVGTSYWYGITYGNGKFVAVGVGGYIATLEDGSSTWDVQQVGTNNWRGITYGNDKFVAVGSSGYIATLEDGSSAWDIQQMDTYSWYGITHGNGKFIAVGNNFNNSGYIATLEDGSSTWNIQQVTIMYPLRGITYGNGKFIAVGNSGYIATLKSLFYSSAPFQPSTRYYLKLNFTKSSADTYDFMYSYSLTNEESSYIPMSNDSYLFSSSTPAISSFTLSGPPTYSLYLDELSIEIDGNQIINKSQNLQGWSTEEDPEVYNLHVAENEVTNTPIINPSESSTELVLNHEDIITSSWSMPIRIKTGETPDMINSDWNGVTYGNGKFVAVGSSGYIATLEDGNTTWTTQRVGTSTWRGITYENGKFIAVGNNGNIATLEDGSSTWETQQVGTSAWQGIAYGNGKFIAAGNNGNIATLEDSNDTWDIQQVGTQNWYGIAYGNGKFIAVGSGGYITTLEDGNDTWETQQVGTFAWEGVAYGNGKFVAVGINSYTVTLKDGSTTWTTPEPVGNHYDWYGITYGNGKFIAVGRNGYIATLEDDSGLWTTQKVGSSYWWGVAYGNGKFVAVGSSGYIATTTSSSSNSEWTTPVTTTGLQLNDIDYWLVDTAYFASNGVFAALQSDGTFSTSLEGSTWEKKNGAVTDPAYDPFVAMAALGQNGVALTSDGRFRLASSTALQSQWISPSLNNQEWKSLTYLNSTTCLGINVYGYIFTMNPQSIASTITESSTSVLGDHDWVSVASNSSVVVALGRGGYISIGTINGSSISSWTTPGQNVNLGSHSWRKIIWDGSKFMAISYRGYTSTSTDGLNWIPAVQSPILEPTSDSYAWSALAYGNKKVLALSDEACYSVQIQNSDDTWEAYQMNNAPQYIIGNSSEAANESPFELSIRDSKLTFTPAIDTLCAWTAADTVVYTTSQFPAYGDYVYSSNKRAIGKVIDSQVSGKLSAYLNENKAIQIFYRDPSEDIEDTITLTSSNNILPDTNYDIEVSFDGTKYSLYYKLDNMGDTSIYPTSEVLNYYSAMPVSLGKRHSIAIGSNNNDYKFLGDIDFSKTSLTTDSFSWIGSSQLNQIYSETIENDSTYTIYDRYDYPIEGVPITTDFGLAVDADIFNVEPNKKYYVRVTYTPITETYKVYKSENGEDYTEAFSQIAEHKMSPVTSVYIGGLASANSSYITDPFQGTVYLKNLRAISANADWSPTAIVGEKEPQVLQYYNIPKYNRNMYVLEDLCNPENTLTVLDTSFTGNTDKIDFSNPLGFSLCTKVFLEDAKDKLLLAKLSPVGDPYFLLSFEGESQEIKFILNTQTQTITLSKKLQTDELASYVESPILLSVILEVEDGLHTFSLYKNNDIIDQVSLGVEGFLDASNSYLTNYLSDPAESKIHVSDIIVVEGTLDTEQLYYVTNLTDTNF